MGVPRKGAFERKNYDDVKKSNFKSYSKIKLYSLLFMVLSTHLLEDATQSQQLLLELQHILDHGIPEGLVIQHQIVRRAM